MKLQLSLVLLLAVGAVIAAKSPQQAVTAPPVLSIQTDLVTLPITVVDPRGGFVTGLRPEHFRVYDNGELQTIKFFASDDLPVTIGLVIDCSGSMRTRRDDVTAAIMAFASMSHPLDEFFTVNFNERVWLGLPRPLGFTQDQAHLRAVLAVAPTSGMTALHDGVYRALDHLRTGTHDRRALIVVSDGGDNASSQTLEVVVERARRTSVVIYSVILFNPDDRDSRPQVLRKLARETGGDAFRPRRAEDVGTAFAQVAREIRSGYTLGFTPADTSAGGFRSIRVVADAGDRRQLIARTRAGYYAGPTGRSGE